MTTSLNHPSRASSRASAAPAAPHSVVVTRLLCALAVPHSARSLIVAFAVAVAALASFESSASATPRALPFTYPYETLAKGELEIEQYADVSPVRAHAPDGSLAWVMPPAFQTEFEYGVTNHLELALYVVYMPGVGGFTEVPELGDTGIRQRVRYRFSDQGELPVDIALYGEVSELTQGLELEGKVILAKHLGDFTLMANLVGARQVAYQGPGAWEIEPSAGVTYQVNPTFHPGLEYWNKTEFPDRGDREFDDGPHHYAGPVMMLNWGKLWWSTGVYARLSDTHHVMDAGEAEGRVWIRSVVGLSL